MQDNPRTGTLPSGGGQGGGRGLASRPSCHGSSTICEAPTPSLPSPRGEGSDFEALYDAVRRGSGLDLREYKQDQLRRRLLTWAAARGDHDLAALGRRLGSDPREMRELLDRVSINVSELYRNPERWRELETKILPDLAKRTTTMRCWSAGCSFGAEAHTLASILEAGSYKYGIVGTDIDEDALETARAGRFDAASMRGVPQKVKERFFAPVGEEWQAGPHLRKSLRFRNGNLLQDRFDANLDLILCRNVVIYFTDEAKDRLYRRFFDALKPGGILFVGGTERIHDSRGIGYEMPLPFFYRKPLEGQKTWRNAS